MIMKELDPLTGLPLIQETRGSKPWMALSRDVGELAWTLHKDPEKPWFPMSHTWENHNLKEVKCWKCGTDLKGWRMALDRHGNQIDVNGVPAVAFLSYDHHKTTPFAIYLPNLKKMGVFQAHHCSDCAIMVADGMNVWTCSIAGTDAILSHMTKQGTSHIGKDAWATYLFRFSGADPQGPTTKEAAMDYEKILSPGDVLTSATLSLLTDASQRNKIPSGVVVEFKGSDIPMGWKPAKKKGKIEKI